MSVATGRHAALVHDWLTGMRGGEKVLAALATLVPEAPIYTLLHVPGSVDPALEARAITSSWIARLPGAAKHYRRYLPLFPAAIEDLDLSPYDLVISTSHCVAKGVVPAPDAVHLSYCHSPMRYAWDQEQIYFPSRRGLIARLRNLALSRLRVWDVASAARVDHFVANSRFVAERIRRYYRRDADVVPPPVAIEDFSPSPEKDQIAFDGRSDEKDDRRCLMIAALAPYKRIEVAIAACERLGIGLDVVGTGPEKNRLERQTSGDVRLLGHVSADRLAELYRRALAFLQPGVEDFGIAAVESLASGTPVVALDRGGVRDIVEDGTHGVLYGADARHLGTTRADFADEVERLAAAIDKRRRLRFNPLEIQDRASCFSTARFLERMQRQIAQLIAQETEGS